jgi:starvation-inducible DNA-binding protein
VPSFTARTIFEGFQHFLIGSSQAARIPHHTFIYVNEWWDALLGVGLSRDTGADNVRCLSALCARGGDQVGREMHDRDGHPALHPTRIDIPQEIRLYLITLLNRTLTWTVDLRSQVKQASWNVKGKELSQLQALFATIATELDAYGDLMAERIVVLGGVALGTACTGATQSTLPEYPRAITAGDAHVLALAERFAPYTAAMRDGITHAADVGDADTAAVYTDISREVDKRLQFLEAYLHPREG